MIRVKTILLFLVGMNIGYIDIFAQYNVTEKFQERLNQFRTHYIQVMLKNKTADLAGYYAESIWLLPEFQKTVIGKNDVLLYHKAFLSRFKIREYTRNEIEIRDLGTQILEVGKFTMKMTLLNSDQQQELKGAYINLWEKLENDRLMLITEAWNYDTYYEGIDRIMRFDEVPSIHLALQPNVPVDSNISFELAAFNRLLDVTVHNMMPMYGRDIMLMTACLFQTTILYAMEETQSINI